MGAERLGLKIGGNSCTTPALVNAPGNIDLDSLDACEGRQWSAFVTPNMRMLPCSFDNQERRWAVDLRENTVAAAWKSEVLDDFRAWLQRSCPDCGQRRLCLGGCSVRPEITLCDRKERSVTVQASPKSD